MSLFLSKLSLSHFRSHRHVQMELDERPVVLFGPNGAGKTNLLEAVSLFSPGRGMRRASAEAMTRRPESIGWKVSGAVASPGGTHEVIFQSKGGGARQVLIDDKPAPQSRLGTFVRMIWLVPAMDRLWIEGAEGRRRFLDRMTLSFFPDHGDAVLIYEKAMRERNRLLKEQVRDLGWYGALEAQMADAGARIHANRNATLARISSSQAQTGTAFPAAELALLAIDGALLETASDLRAAYEESRFRDMAAGRTLVGPHRTDLRGTYVAKGVDAADCSTGEQKALLISIILANARALKDDLGAPPIVLLDEVSAHLDADRRAALYQEICALGAQAWMTGTDRSVFSELGSRARFFAVSDDNGSSVVRPVSDD